MTNEEILKEQKIVKYQSYFIKAMNAARNDEAIKFGGWLEDATIYRNGEYFIIGEQPRVWYSLSQAYSVFKKQNL